MKKQESVATMSRKKLQKMIDQQLPKAYAGNADAQFNLGVLYTSCHPKFVNNEEGVRWFEKAAALGRSYALFNLSMHYEKGLGVKKDIKKAAELMERAADSGYVDAQINMGSYYLDGIGVERSEDKAISWYEKALEQGASIAAVNIGRIHLNRGNMEDAIRSLTIAGDKGEISAVEHLSFINGELRNIDEQVRWGKYGAVLGSIPCQIYLANIYSDKSHPHHNPEEALKYAHQAAKAGDGFAHFVLGNIYENGFDEPQYNYALECYSIAARQGVVQAMHSLGLAYRDGKGTQADIKKALKYLREAATQGYSPSLRVLGKIHEDGKFVDQDYVIAKSFYEAAIAAGCDSSVQSLAALYLDGNGVTQSDLAGYILMVHSLSLMDENSEMHAVCKENIRKFDEIIDAAEREWGDLQATMWRSKILAAVDMAICRQ